jgi:hypothetical protein
MSSSMVPLGVGPRILIGFLLVGLELFWRGPKWWDAIVWAEPSAGRPSATE